MRLTRIDDAHLAGAIGVLVVLLFIFAMVRC